MTPVLLQNVLTVLFVVGAVAKLVEVPLRRRDRVSPALLAGAFAALAAGLALSVPAVVRALDAVTAGAGKIVYNGLTFLGLYLLVVFFVRALRGAAGVSRIRFEAMVLVAVLAVLVGVLALTRPDQRAHTLSSPYLGEPAVAAFYLVGGAYFVHAYVAVIRLTWAYVRAAAGVLALALRTVTLGLVVLTLTSLVRIGRVVAVASGGPALPSLNSVNFALNLVGYGILAVGLVAAGWGQALVVVRRQRLHRRRHDALEPLWTVLTARYPELVLPSGATGRRRWLPGAADRRLYRRVLECRDGLLRAGPHIAAAAGTTDVAALPPQTVARHLVTLTPASGEPDPDPVAVATPDAADLDGDVDALVAISAALPAASPAPGGVPR